MRLLTLLLLGLLAAVPARAQSSTDQSATVLTALAQIPADASLWGNTRIVDIVDLAALRRVAGVSDRTRFTDFVGHRLDEADELAATSLLWRLQSGAGFIQYLISGSEFWPEQIGIDFFQLAWFSEAGTPPNTILFLGGEALPRGEGLAVLGKSGFAPVDRDGTTVWVKGEHDNGIDVQHREIGMPFWGWLGSSVRAFRGEQALVGARSWGPLDLALAVERGKAESLADLPAFRLAAEVAAHPDYSAGPILQMTFVDQQVGAGGVAPSPEGLPPYQLLAFADREDAAGQQLVLVLAYGTDAETAAAVAKALPVRIAAYRDKGGNSLADRFPGLAVTATPLETENGAAAVVVLAIPPLPVRSDEGKVQNRSPLYGQALRMLWSRDLAILAPRG